MTIPDDRLCYAAYKCETCDETRYLTIIKAIINGVMESNDDAFASIDKTIDCHKCGESVTVLYTADTTEESLAFYAALIALGEGGKQSEYRIA